MSKIFEGILKIVLVILFFAGIAFLESIIRSHILLPIIALLLTLLLAFLFYKAPDFLDNSLNDVLKYTFYFSVAVSFTCFVFASKSEAYIEKSLLGGKVRQTEVETEGPNGELGSTTDYYLEDVSPTNDRIIRYSYWILVLGTPFLIWKMWQKSPRPK